MLHLLDLNDDCLENICQFLNLNQQLAVKDVCTRLNDAIKAVWRRRRRITLERYQLCAFRIASADFIELLSSVTDTLRELHLNDVDSQQLMLLQHLKFSKVQTLECENWHDDVSVNDSDVQLLVKVFPALTKLVLVSNITGKHICDWRNIVDLDLSCCDELQETNLIEIVKTLKLRKLSLLVCDLTLDYHVITRCATLEELIIDCLPLSQIIYDVLAMPLMRKLTAIGSDENMLLTKAIADRVDTRVHSMLYNAVFGPNPTYLSSLGRMKNLRRLVMNEERLTSEQMDVLARKFPHLQAFHFTRGYLEREDSLLLLVQHCEHLNLIDVSHTPLSASFLDKLVLCVNTTGQKRQLDFYCTGPEIMTVDLEQLNVPKQLHIIREECDLQLPESPCCECSWIPQTEAYESALSAR